MDLGEGTASEGDPWCRQYVELAVGTDDGDFDPDDVTTLVGLIPTGSARGGDTLSSGVQRKHAAWSFRLGEWQRTIDSEAVVVELLDVIEAHRGGLARASEAGLSGVLSLVVEMYSVREGNGDLLVSAPALSFGRETIKRIADLNLSLDCDQYVL